MRNGPYLALALLCAAACFIGCENGINPEEDEFSAESVAYDIESQVFDAAPNRDDWSYTEQTIPGELSGSATVSGSFVESSTSGVNGYSYTYTYSDVEAVLDNYCNDVDDHHLTGTVTIDGSYTDPALGDTFGSWIMSGTVEINGEYTGTVMFEFDYSDKYTFTGTLNYGGVTYDVDSNPWT